jgi:hypothetical protein
MGRAAFLLSVQRTYGRITSIPDLTHAEYRSLTAPELGQTETQLQGLGCAAYQHMLHLAFHGPEWRGFPSEPYLLSQCEPNSASPYLGDSGTLRVSRPRFALA